MSKRKHDRTPTTAPSPHDKLSSSFLEALEKKWEASGPELLNRMADTDPVRVCELVAKLVPIKPPAPVTNEKELNSTADIARNASARSAVTCLAPVNDAPSQHRTGQPSELTLSPRA